MSEICCQGFKASGIAAGIKKNGKKDLGLIYSEVPASVAGVFTRNRVQAAPVLIDKERIKSGKCQAIIANSGNANCCTGEQGMADAKAMTRLIADAFGIAEETVCVASTGVIGEPMPIRKVETAIPQLTEALTSEGLTDFAESILTTDLVTKTVCREGNINGTKFTVTGVAKGSGMIRPDMATMLCFVMTDAEVDTSKLQAMLTEANEGSFNRITVDGDTSTNDTVLVMANGKSGAVVQTREDEAFFQKILNEVLTVLARKVVEDGEGVTKLVEVVVKGAESDSDARQMADVIAHSSLVKTALFGEDANWGRIAAAAGRAGVPMNPDALDIFFNDVMMAKNGMTCGKEAEASATQVMKQPAFTITVDLNMGSGESSMLTCDFSLDYVKINADYRS